MNKTALKNFATNARKELIEKVKAKAFRIGITEENIKKAQFESSDAIYIDGKQLSATEKKQREKLISRIKEIGYKQVVEEVSYTWFNRFTALRFMEVNNYLPTKVRVLSSSIPDSTEPDIIKEALTIDLDIDKDLVYELKINNKTEELFKYLVIKQCNNLNEILPFMFETIDDFKEILFPDGLLGKETFLREMTNTQVFPETDWEQVEIIGWLYQFYISEKKDQVFSDLKMNIKISKENIPAATQLFTPHWIVRYMVENTLGRIWLESYSDSGLKAEWKYYMEEAEQEQEVKNELEKISHKNIDPESMTFLDPCCGSGHILVYAFDVFYSMYLEKGYIEHEIPKLILEKNLFGVDIDDRAAQLASFAVMMKAREKSRRVFGQEIRLNICAIQESNWMKDETVEVLVDKQASQLNQEIQRKTLLFVRDTFLNAKLYGSILNVGNLNLDFIEEQLQHYTSGSEFQGDILERIAITEALEKLPALVKQARVMTRKYSVVCTNPPYMGSGGMNPELSSYLKQNYPNTKSDMSTVFMEKAFDLCHSSGMISMINIPVWMFLSSYEKLRENIIQTKTFTNMLHFGRGVFGSDFGTTSFVISNTNIKQYKAIYRKLFQKQGSVDSIERKEQWFFENMGYYEAKQDEFQKIPGSTIAYWATPQTIKSFKNNLKNEYRANTGISTGYNEKYIFYWHEVPFNKIYTEEVGKEGYDYFPLSKGGEFRKWYGNRSHVILYNQMSIQEMGELPGFRHDGKESYFKNLISWSKVTSSVFSARYYEPIFVFNSAAPAIGSNKVEYVLLGYLNSKLTNYFLEFINPTINFSSGYVEQLPYKTGVEEKIKSLVETNIIISKSDWNDFEESWEFTSHPFLKHRANLGFLSHTFQNWSEHKESVFIQLKENEEEVNRIFIELFELQAELNPHVLEGEITTRKADKFRDVKSFVSYSVGCMYGRYSLDEEGLVFAGGKFDAEKFEMFPADKDNILPILSSAYFEDDIVTRFLEFVESTFGEEALAENLEFIAESFGRKNGETAKETIRRYFIDDFFKDHLQTYKKKPIYWLFTSGKQKAFNCLIYVHRYDKSTLSRIRTDYLHELQIRMDVEKKTLLEIINGDGTTKEISNAKKELKSLDLKIEELRAYDEKLHHMADMQIEIDLDDGVTVNYAKFEGLLAPIQ
jgi:hypothetical protein